ncbi:heavy-metal-associated domain-containing protein [Butyrivibrio sp. DSM 10294]|uniref:heavy-metal-associated domain-containing protein n=1 Tax=Butyrivibrio sp. DSM 10294 TaxID=2972457 RepID=UPI00234E8574|nr:heavy metal-associated domain-containing protein [Butyrivibrio sp. DSM 10294]MDC7292079.1 heavy-metal-associated domain-containing protein [Butyrivibrio sp. DSM 10294]
MVSNGLIISGLAIILFLAIRGSVKHFLGQGSCCGGGSSTVREPDKKLKGPVIKTRVFKIDGMHCENCTNRVKRAINRIDGVSARLNLRKKEAIVQFEADLEDTVITSEIERLGYQVLQVISK